MTYDEIIEMVKEYADAIEIDNNGHFAVEVNITDKGVFSVELEDGKVNVEPNGYPGCDVWVTTDSDTFLELANAKLSPTAALFKGKLKAGGDKKKALQYLPYMGALKKVMKARAKAH